MREDWPQGAIKSREEAIKLIKPGEDLVFFRVGGDSGIHKRVGKLRDNELLVYDIRGCEVMLDSNDWYGITGDKDVCVFANYWFAYAYWLKIKEDALR